MANTKDDKRQDRRKKQTQKRVIIIAVVALVAAAAVFGVFKLIDYLDNRQTDTIENPQNNNDDTVSAADPEYDPFAGRETVAVIGGVPISEAEFVYYFLNQIRIFEEAGGESGEEIWNLDLGGQSAEDFAKQETLKVIRELKELARRAADLGLNLTGQKLNEITERSEIYEITYLPEHIVYGYGVNKDVIKTCETDTALSNLLFEYYTNDIGITTPEQEAELENYIQMEADYWYAQAAEEGDDAPFTDEEMQQIRDRVTEWYINQIRLEEYRKIKEGWVDDIEIVINDSILDGITVQGLKAMP